jgi:hypothetical protein
MHPEEAMFAASSKIHTRARKFVCSHNFPSLNRAPDRSDGTRLVVAGAAQGTSCGFAPEVSKTADFLSSIPRQNPL